MNKIIENRTREDKNYWIPRISRVPLTSATHALKEHLLSTLWACEKQGTEPLKRKLAKVFCQRAPVVMRFFAAENHAVVETTIPRQKLSHQ